MKDAKATVVSADVMFMQDGCTLYLGIKIEGFELDSYVMKCEDFCGVLDDDNDDQEVVKYSEILKVMKDISVMHFPNGRIKKICLRGKWIDIE